MEELIGKVVNYAGIVAVIAMIGIGAFKHIKSKLEKKKKKKR